MLYSSERNYGCRFLEVSIYGYRSLIVENEKIRTLIIVDKGCEIVEFNYKPQDTDFIWRSPLGLSCIKKIQYAKKDNQILTDGYTGGWFECFPNVGGACNYMGADIPQYGEVAFLPWEYTVIEDEDYEVSIKCFVKTTKTPYYLEKVFTVKKNDPTLYIKEKVKNIGCEDLLFQWGHHPNFGSNFIDENCVIDINAEEIRVHHAPENSILEVGQTGIWPNIEDKNGNLYDLSKVRSKESLFMAVVDVFNLKEGSTSVYNNKKNLGIRLEWDLNMFKHNLIWYVFGGDSGYPRYGNTYVLGFVPHNDISWGLLEATGKKDSPIIKSGETKKTWINATVYKK